MLDWSLRGRGLEPQQRHLFVSLSKNINPSLALVQPRKTYPYIAEKLLMGRKESIEQNKALYNCTHWNIAGSLPPATEDFDEENNIKTITEYKYNEDNKMVKVRRKCTTKSYSCMLGNFALFYVCCFFFFFKNWPFKKLFQSCHYH